MIETGKIREINGNSVVVEPEKGGACFGCMNQECRNSGKIIAENSRSLSLAMGQNVEVSAAGSSVFAQALAALLPPAAGFIGGYFAARFFFGEAGAGAFAGAGVLLSFAAAFIVYKIRSKYPAAKEYTVTRIIEQD